MNGIQVIQAALGSTQFLLNKYVEDLSDADLLVRMTLSVWREERAFAGTEPAAAFDQTMTGLTAAVAPTRPEPLP